MRLNAILGFFTVLLSVFLSDFTVAESCDNTPSSRDCWGDYNISTDYYKVIPDTGATKEVRWIASPWELKH